jgi:hypothetical protein
MTPMMRKMTSPLESDCMASPGQLVHVLAAALGIPEATLAQHDRNLRNEGLRSVRGRGWAAPNVTARDLAQLIIAILGSAQVKDSDASVRRYAATRAYAPRSSENLFARLGIDELAALPREHSFIDVLEALIVAASTGSLAKSLARQAKKHKSDMEAVAPLIEVAALTPGTSGEIRIAGLRKDATASVTYAQPTPWDKPGGRMPGKRAIEAWEERVKKRRVETDLEQSRRISQKTIVRAAAILSGTEEQG